MKSLILGLSFTLNFVLLSSLGFAIYQDARYIPPTNEEYQAFGNAIKTSSAFIRETKLSDNYFKTVSKEAAQIKMNAWLPYWAMDEGLKSLEEKKHLFDTVNPVYYEVNADGTINVKKEKLEDLKEIIKGTKVKILPTISQFDAEGFSIILSDNEKIARHIDFLIKEVDDNNFDGLDLDYESIYLKDKENFYKLVDSLSKKLKERSKLLSITVLSKWGDNIEYGFAPETREVQDYSRLSAYADQFRIMTYDFTSSGSTKSGPIAPVNWVEQVLDYAVKRVPKEKLILGVHLYGYVWENGKQAFSVDYRQVSEIKKENESVQFLENRESKETAIKYDYAGSNFFGYFASIETIRGRIDLAAKYGIDGVAYWRLGDDPL